MTTPFEKLWEFHTAFNQKRETVPALPDADTRALRKRLLDEEFNEYLTAEAEDDLVEIADALADIIYISLGTAVSYGLPMDAIFNEVHRSNMSKLDPETGKPIYRTDGKVMKPATWSPPQIEQIIEAAKKA